MYSYSGLVPWEGVWPLLQPLTYTYLPAPLLLPPIQAHTFCSRPPSPSPSAGAWAAPREYHCFHHPAAPPAAAPPWWAFPQAYAAALRPPFSAPSYLGPSLPAAPGSAAAEGWAPWPEGGSLQAELRWGRVERASDPRLELPDYVRRELRRVYGTYPRTDVRVTYRDGEFLLRAAPRVSEPEARVERRALRPAAGGASDSRGGSRGHSGPAAEVTERGRRRKGKGLS